MWAGAPGSRRRSAPRGRAILLNLPEVGLPPAGCCFRFSSLASWQGLLGLCLGRTLTPWPLLLAAFSVQIGQFHRKRVLGFGGVQPVQRLGLRCSPKHCHFPDVGPACGTTAPCDCGCAALPLPAAAPAGVWTPPFLGLSCPSPPGSPRSLVTAAKSQEGESLPCSPCWPRTPCPPSASVAQRKPR